jgi:hypothetical protein
MQAADSQHESVEDYEGPFLAIERPWSKAWRMNSSPPLTLLGPRTPDWNTSAFEAPCRVPTTLAQRQIALFHQAWKYEGNEFPLENMRLPPGTIIEMGAYKGMKMPHILELWDKQLDRIVQKLHPLSHLDPSPCQAMGPQKSVTSYCPTHSHFYYHGIEMRPSNFRWLAASELKLKGLKLRGVGVESLHKPAASSRPAPPTRVCESKMSADIGDRLMSSMQASDVPNHATDNLRCTMMNVTTLDHFVTTHVRSPITLVKIDAEGFDGMILMSAKETLSQRKAAVVTFECCTHWHRARLSLQEDPFRGGAKASIPSLARAAQAWGYDLYLMGGRSLLWLSPEVHNDAELELFGTCGWCCFALFRRTPEVMYVPQQFRTDNQFCKQD